MTAAVDQVSATIDDEVQTQLAERAGAKAGSTSGAIEVTELHGSLGAGTHVYRFAGDSTADRARWSFVVKIFDLPGPGFTEPAPTPTRGTTGNVSGSFTRLRGLTL